MNNKEFEMIIIKIIDIGYITCIYFSVAYISAKYLDKLFNKMLGKIDPKKKYSKMHIIIDILIQTAITGIISYIGKNLIQIIPFPLNQYHGFDHMRVKEVNSGALLTSFLVMFQTNLQNKIMYLRQQDQ
jgi:hypothetical protein